MEAWIEVVRATDHQDRDLVLALRPLENLLTGLLHALVELFERAEALVDRPITLVDGDPEALPPSIGACTS